MPTPPIPSGASQRRHNDLVLSFLALRRAIGVIGFFLPAALLFWAGATGQFPPTMSEFYYTPMSDVFVGSLSAIAVFLWSYEGYREPGRLVTDRNTARAASLGALGVALCPSATTLQGAPAPPLTVSQRLFGVPLTETLHYASAALFFVALAVFCLVLFVRGGSAAPTGAPVRDSAAWRAERREHLLYRFCGWVILATVAAIVLIHQFGAPEWLLRMRPVFWLEVAACVGFATSWLVKGRTLEAPRG